MLEGIQESIYLLIYIEYLHFERFKNKCYHFELMCFLIHRSLSMSVWFYVGNNKNNNSVS